MHVVRMTYVHSASVSSMSLVRHCHVGTWHMTVPFLRKKWVIIVYGPRRIPSIHDCHYVSRIVWLLLSVNVVYNHEGQVELSRDAVDMFNINEKLIFASCKQSNTWKVDSGYVTFCSLRRQS